MQSIYVTPRGTTMRRTLVSLLDHDPDLGALLRDEREASARRDVQVERHEIASGQWHPAAHLSAARCAIGLLVISGAVVREITVEDQPSAELLAPGDLIRTAPQDDPTSAGSEATWTALTPCVALPTRRTSHTIHRPLPGDHARAHRANRNPRATPRRHAGDLTDDRRRSPPRNPLLAPRRKLGQSPSRRRADPARPIAPTTRKAHRRTPANRVNRARTASPTNSASHAAPTAPGSYTAPTHRSTTRSRSPSVCSPQPRTASRPDQPARWRRTHRQRPRPSRAPNDAAQRRCQWRTRTLRRYSDGPASSAGDGERGSGAAACASEPKR